MLAICARESLGIPFPGEATLIGAAIYAGPTHRLDIGLVIAAAAAGAIRGWHHRFLRWSQLRLLVADEIWPSG